MRDPKSDPVLIGLKKVALAGGERGPLYDRGVLDTIAAIERDGSCTKNAMCQLITLFATEVGAASPVILPDEVATVKEYLRSRHWTKEQALQYASGVEAAEKTLPGYVVSGRRELR